MNFFWANLFDYVRERRNAGLFFGVLTLVFGVMAVMVICQRMITCDFDFKSYWPTAIPAVAFFLLVWTWRARRRRRARRLNGYQRSPLSRDELLKARSKLAGQKTFTRS